MSDNNPKVKPKLYDQVSQYYVLRDNSSLQEAFKSNWPY